jgi:hypothetical protein
MKYDRNPAPHRLLKRGMRGADVKSAQKATNTSLKAAGSKRRLKLDGVCGTKTLQYFGYACHHRGSGHRRPTVGNQRIVRWPWTRTRAQKRTAEARRPKRPVAGQLSPNFHISEFHCRDGTPVPQTAVPALKTHCEDILEPMRRRHGAVVITGPYRHRAYNASIGGASGSYHIYDEHPDAPATDIRCGKGNVWQWAASAAEFTSKPAGIGTYPGSGFVHIDRRGYHSRWNG